MENRSTPKRRRLRFGLRTMLLAVVVAAIASQFYSSRHSALAAKAERLAAGMTPLQIQQVLGAPWASKNIPNPPGAVDRCEMYYEQGRVGKSNVQVNVYYARGRMRTVDVLRY